MTLFVKICGVTTAETLDAAVAAGADAIGFVFHGPSPRNIEPRLAAMLARRLPGGIRSVAVTLHPRAADVERVLDTFVPAAWQSDAGDFDAMALPGGVERWPVLRSWDATSAVVGRVVFDAPTSGVGQRADWQGAAVLARHCELVLAGGLDVASVGAAIVAVQPFGVDVSSGVELAPGVKDAARIRAFISAARAGAERRTA